MTPEIPQHSTFFQRFDDQIDHELRKGEELHDRLAIPASRVLGSGLDSVVVSFEDQAIHIYDARNEDTDEPSIDEAKLLLYMEATNEVAHYIEDHQSGIVLPSGLFVPIKINPIFAISSLDRFGCFATQSPLISGPTLLSVAGDPVSKDIQAQRKFIQKNGARDIKSFVKAFDMLNDELEAELPFTDLNIATINAKLLIPKTHKVRKPVVILTDVCAQVSQLKVKSSD